MGTNHLGRVRLRVPVYPGTLDDTGIAWRGIVFRSISRLETNLGDGMISSSATYAHVW